MRWDLESEPNPSLSSFWELPVEKLELGSERARGANGLVRNATLCGTPVAAKALHALLRPSLYGVDKGSESYTAMVKELRREAKDPVCGEGTLR